MTARSTTFRRRVGVALAAPFALGAAVLAPAPAAQAHEDIVVKSEWRWTSDCPCYLDDDHDGTYFEKDIGGRAYKGQIFSKGELVGKVEFHPQGEKLWLYDTKANGDALYVKIAWPGRGHYYKVPSGHMVRDLDIPEGTHVTITVWDDGFHKGLITEQRAWA